MNLSNMQTKITQSFGRGSLYIQKYSPEILLGVGLVGGVVAAVLAAKATLKAEEILIEAQEDFDKVNQMVELSQQTDTPVSYTEEDHQKDLAIVYVQTGLKFAKLYAPAVGLGVLSISAILSSHGIMTRRQVSLIAAYNLLNEGFQSYRKRVVEELGEDVDRSYHLGLREEEVTEKETDPDGKSIKVKKKIQKYDPQFKSEYARFFDESSPNWKNDASLNLYFLKIQQNYANDLLISRGHVFLNEVYDMLGLPRSKAGSIVGWVLDKGGGDKYVDFDIYNPENAPGRDFVNGYNPSILLDFNVDGVIFDLI